MTQIFRMMKKTIQLFVGLIVFLTVFDSNPVLAQEVWTLEKCINYARENNISLKQSMISVGQANINLKANKAQRIPSLNYNTSAGYQWGRTIDYGTNTYVNESTNFNSHSIQAGINLYNGGQVSNSIRQSGIDLMAARKDSEQLMENISLTIATQYLTILLAQEAVEIAKKRLETSKKQLDQTDKLISAGSLPKNERLMIQATVATDEENLLIQQNNVDLGYLDLKNLLNLDPATDMTIKKPEVDQFLIDNTLLTNVEELFKKSADRNPGVAANNLKIESARIGKKIASSTGLPSLDIFGSFNTNYSSSILDLLHPDLSNLKEELSNPTKVNINGMDVFIATYNKKGISYPSKPYFSQLQDNLGQSLGLSLRIPIYNAGITHYNKQRADLAIKLAELNSDLTKQQLKNQIYRAVTDYKAARLRVEVAQRENEAAQGSFVNLQKKYDAGASNSLELITAKNNADAAEDNLLTARYSLIFRTKVLEYYMGQPIQLN